MKGIPSMNPSDGPEIITTADVCVANQDQFGVDWPAGFLVPTHICVTLPLHNFTRLKEL